MGLTNTGRDFIAKAIINDTPTFFNITNTHIGVGDGVTAFTPTQTDLVGANKTRSQVTQAPVRTGNTLEFKTVYNNGDANHTWAEWAVFNASTSGEMLNRKVEALGTKTGGVWVLTITLSVNIA